MPGNRIVAPLCYFGANIGASKEGSGAPSFPSSGLAVDLEAFFSSPALQ